MKAPLFKVNNWEEALAKYVGAYSKHFGSQRMRMESIEQQLYESVDEFRSAAMNTPSESDKENYDANGFPLHIKTPSIISLSHTQSLIAYLSSTFAFESPIFKLTRDQAFKHVTTAVNRKISKDAVQGRWALQFIKTAVNAAMFDYGPMQQTVNTVAGRVELKALCPYNTLVDISAGMEYVADRGSYSVNVSLMTMAALYVQIANTQERGQTTAAKWLIANPDKIAEFVKFARSYGSGGCGSGYTFHQPSDWMQHLLASMRSDANNDINWAEFATSAEGKSLNPQHKGSLFVDGNKFAIATINVRGFPSWLGLPEKDFPAPNYGTIKQVPVYRITMFGPFVLTVEESPETHGMIPITVAQVRATTSLTSRASFAELTIPAQAVASKFDNARLSALRNMLGRPMAYFEEALASSPDAKHLKLRQPTKDRPEEPDKRISDLILPLGLDGDAVSALLGDMGSMYGLAEQVVGSSAQMRGGRIPGNKRPGEAEQERTMAEAPYRTYAITYQETCISPHRDMLLANYALLTAHLKFRDPNTAEMQTVTQEHYENADKEFEGNKALSNGGNQITPEGASAMLNAFSQIPVLQQQYDMRDVVDLLAHSLGMDFSNIPTGNLSQQIQQQILSQTEGQVDSSEVTPEGAPTDPNAADDQALAEAEAQAAAPTTPEPPPQ